MEYWDFRASLRNSSGNERALILCTAPLKMGQILSSEIEVSRSGQSVSETVEESTQLAPKFDRDGLVTCVTTDATSGDVLMVAHMNADALTRTVQTAEAWYFSRSRKKLWRKGESSGHIQRVVEMRVDCDQDAVWIKVDQVGPGACHTGRRSCFYRNVVLGSDSPGALTFRDAERAFDPHSVYGDQGSGTKS